MYEGSYFIFDNVPSQRYNLMIVSFGANKTNYAGGSAMNVVKDKADRSQKYEMLSSTPGEPLSFDMEIVCTKGEIPLSYDNIIKSWLFGTVDDYKRLYILNHQMNNVYFNCYLDGCEDICISGKNGYKFTVYCDAGGAWMNAQTKTYTIGATPTNILFNNTSGDNDYLRPDVEFTVTNGGAFSIVNASDNGREMKFTSLLAGETIKINGETNQVGSYSEGHENATRRFHVLENFNKNYLRLKRGVNNLTVTGQGTLKITYKNFVRLGG